jgi:hypothetical protein
MSTSRLVVQAADSEVVARCTAQRRDPSLAIVSFLPYWTFGQDD